MSRRLAPFCCFGFPEGQLFECGVFSGMFFLFLGRFFWGIMCRWGFLTPILLFGKDIFCKKMEQDSKDGSRSIL